LGTLLKKFSPSLRFYFFCVSIKHSAYKEARSRHDNRRLNPMRWASEINRVLGLVFNVIIAHFVNFKHYKYTTNFLISPLN